MDSNTLLDYALFHLTPTRTRCDLVVFCGGKSEKLASGLVEPFIAHLKYAKDQILKGGYSITLRPPSADAFWFTKGTFQRFVQFISTPEILERFIRIEREILQIESSIQSNEISSGNNAGNEMEGSSLAADGVYRKTTSSFKSKSKVEGTDGDAVEENSKLRLQRVLHTRKSLLVKEQAMAYARARAAGFNVEYMDDLVYFADAFGASRLREACIDFRNLYKQKHKDAQWMDELAAMETCPPNELSYLGTSGIILAGENNGSNLNFLRSGGLLASNGSSNDSELAANQTAMAGKDTAANEKLKVPLPNQVPQYMYQQLPPHQGYPFPIMHPMPPYYPGHVHWPNTTNDPANGLARDATSHKSRKSSKKKKKSRKGKGSETSEDDEQSESGGASSGTDIDKGMKHDKKHSPGEKPYVTKKKKSSKTVVIRNINYITSNRRTGENDIDSDGSSSDEALILDQGPIKQDVVDIKDLAADISDGGQRNGNWNALQSLLMSQEESLPTAVQERRSLDMETQFADRSSHDDIPFTSSPALDVESEKVKVQHLATDISVAVTNRDGCNEGRINMVDFSNIEERHPSVKRRDAEDVQLLTSWESKESGSYPLGVISDPAADSSLIRNGNREDWFIVSRSENLEMQEAKQTDFDERKTLSSEQDRLLKESSRRMSIDDSFMVQSRPIVEYQHDAEWKTDISIISDLTKVPQPENCGPNVSHSKLGEYGSQEPDDLYVVLARDSLIESSPSWTPEMDYGIDISLTEAGKRSAVETNSEETYKNESQSSNGRNAVGGSVKSSGKETRSKLLHGPLVKGKADGSSKSKKLASSSRLMGQKSKLETEDEIRKRMEELAIQRQKRIAERTASNGSSFSSSKKAVAGSKTASPRLEKNRPQSMMHETRRLSFPKSVPLKS